MCKKYDYLIVGSGLFGSVFAHEATLRGKKCLVLERRDHVGGNIYCEEIEGVTVHRYGAHIFHTANRRVWKYVNDLAEFNRFTNSPIANYKGEIYNMPFNMNTFSKLWGVVTPNEAREKIEAQRGVVTGEPKNLEEQAIRLVGTDIYAKLIKGYTEKQWGRPCARSSPAFIIKRLPVRYTYDNNYFNDPYQGIPVNGYNEIIDKLLDGIEVRTDVDYLANRAAYDALAEKVVYTGTIRFLILIINAVSLSTEACASKPKFWIHRIIKALRSSTIRTVKRRIRASSSISILRSVSRKKRSSRANILRFGSRGWKHLTLSITKKTARFINSIRHWPMPNRT